MNINMEAIAKRLSKFKDMFYYPDLLKFIAKITNAEEALEFVEIIISNFKYKLVRVTLSYNLLDGEKFLLYRNNLFRSVTFQNIETMIIKDIEKWVMQRGEIYHPENPFHLSFFSIKVWLSELKVSDVNIRIPRGLEYAIGSNFIYKAVSVRNVLDAMFFNKNQRFLTRNDNIKIPKRLNELGINNLRDIYQFSLLDQIKLFNLSGRKNSMYEKPVYLIDYNKINDMDKNLFNKYTIVSYNKGLKLISPVNLLNLTYKRRTIKSRKISLLCNTILIFYDTEWTWNKTNDNKVFEKEKPDFISYCIVYGNTYCLKNGYDFVKNSNYFLGADCMSKFFQLLYSIQSRFKNSEIYCISHNGSKIEHQFIVNHIVNGISQKYENYKIKFEHIDGTIIHSFMWRGIFFVDSIKTFPGSLDDLCKSINKKHFKVSICKKDLLNTDWFNPSEKMIQYAVMDSVCLAEIWFEGTKILDEVFGLPGYGYINYAFFKTGSAIVKWYLTRDHASKSNENNDNENNNENNVKEEPLDISELGWDNYEVSGLRNILFFGGRNECFWIGTSKTFVERHKKEYNTAFALKIDRVSSYPTEMVKEPMPGRVVKTSALDNLEELDRLLNNTKQIYLIRGEIKYKERVRLPLIPYRTDKLIFPNFMSGEIAVCLWCSEYREIRSNIEYINNIEVLTFDKTYAFCDKIKTLFDLRQEAKLNNDTAKSFVLKILMNSGYGSLALNPIRETAYLVKGTKIEEVINKYSENTIINSVAGFKWIIVKEKKEVNSMTFVASYITARARLSLWKVGKDLIDNEKATLLMCDTDSWIFVDYGRKYKHYKQKFKDKGLGSWILEKIAKVWEIRTLKVYRFGSEVKYKGITGTSKELVKNGKIINRVVMDIWSRGRDNKLILTKQIKNMSLKYMKGIFNDESGEGYVFPFDY